MLDGGAPIAGAIPERVQALVIGSGPGGAITACRLAEAGKEVLILEEGELFREGFCAPFSLAEMAAKYRSRGLTPALGNPPVTYVEGKCAGGGSEINSGLYHRTPPEILERWRREFEVEGLEEADLRPHFEEVERDLSVGLLPHAAPAASLKLHEGALALGWKSVEVPRWYKYADGKGTPQTMSRTFLPRAMKAGAQLVSRMAVTSFRQEGSGWVVHARSGARKLEVRCEQLFLCAGAIQTPALLRRSGITEKIGNSLHLHPTVKVVARFPERVNETGQGVPVHQVKEFSPELSFGCSISTPEYLGLALLDHPSELPHLEQNWPQMAIYYAMAAVETTGTVRVLPGVRDPLVRYQVAKRDMRILASGARHLSQLLFAAGAEQLFLSVGGVPALRRGADLDQIPVSLPRGRTNLMTIHLFSTCPMGENRRRCATDSFGRVHGFPNLFINDASLLCTAPTVNPQGSIMAIASRNMAHLLHRS